MNALFRFSSALPASAVLLLIGACSPGSQTADAANDAPSLLAPAVQSAEAPSATTVAAPASAESPTKAQPAAVTAGKGLSTATPLKVLFDDPAAKSVLETHMPLLVQFAPRMPGMLDQSLDALASRPEMRERGGLTPELVGRINDDLKRL
jgi:hypothetical protein